MKFGTHLAAAICIGLGAPALAHDFGFAGILSNTNQGEDLPTFMLGAGKPITDGPITLESGKIYELEIEADGSAELALEGQGFFRNIWVNEVVINGLEVRPFGLESVEFDQAGTMEIEFIAIKPGQYYLRIPGSSGEAQRVDITIR
ncbi:cupredoxin domain-containing protein [Roseivivax sp. CAU 1761]